MKILVINAGSSSLKFQLLENVTGYSLQRTADHTRGKNKHFVPGGKSFRCLFKGMIDKIGGHHNDYEKAVKTALQMLLQKKIITSIAEIKAVGHRVVHGGEKYRQSTLITPKVIRDIHDLSELAPLHNPPNLEGIKACQKLLPRLRHVAVFDTSFHHTIPETAYLYALPYQYYQKMGIRRYGFHGTSHRYVAQQTLELLKATHGHHQTGKDQGPQPLKSKIIICHLGNGSSITAVKDGKSIDTSMGFTPLEGIPMGTRTGDFDPAIIFHLLKVLKISPEKMATILNKESGLKGLSGLSSDMRDLWAAHQKPNIKRTLAVLNYRIAKYIGGYAAALQGLDAITFTGGIGENAYYIRSGVCAYLKHLGVQLDQQKNRKNMKKISSTKSNVKVFVIPTNEEEQIARETITLVKKPQPSTTTFNS